MTAGGIQSFGKHFAKKGSHKPSSVWNNRENFFMKSVLIQTRTRMSLKFLAGVKNVQ